jgi:hypothetical protein
LPNQPGLPAINADPANAPVGAASGVNVFGLSQRSLRFIVVTHGQASDPFWAVVQNGAQAAGRELGVSVTYEAPYAADVARMNQLIDAAIAAKPSGLVVSLPNPTALSVAVRKAERAGIPVISINSGADAFRQLGTLLHVGQDEYQAGFSAGERMGRPTSATRCALSTRPRTCHCGGDAEDSRPRSPRAARTHRSSRSTCKIPSVPNGRSPLRSKPTDTTGS